VAAAHEIRPAYLEVAEFDDGLYLVLWNTPIKAGRVLPIHPEFPPHCQRASAPEVHGQEFSSAQRTQRWRLDCRTSGLAGHHLRIRGLGLTLTDVLVSFKPLEGTSLNAIVRPESPQLFIDAGGTNPVLLDYLVLGMEHIMLGADHLLFVFGLLLLVRRVGHLAMTVTAFTLAHSLTLVVAIFHVAVPRQPVEVMIALSLLFLARDIVRTHRHRQVSVTSYPWIMAFLFGLLHGFGFAGALTEIRLAEEMVVVVLLLFNLGIEIGQLLFLVVVGSLGALLWRYFAVGRQHLTVPCAYGLGAIAVFWVMDRFVLLTLPD